MTAQTNAEAPEPTVDLSDPLAIGIRLVALNRRMDELNESIQALIDEDSALVARIRSLDVERRGVLDELLALVTPERQNLFTMGFDRG